MDLLPTPMRVLVTGDAGFRGSNLCQQRIALAADLRRTVAYFDAALRAGGRSAVEA